MGILKNTIFKLQEKAWALHSELKAYVVKKGPDANEYFILKQNDLIEFLSGCAENLKNIEPEINYVPYPAMLVTPLEIPQRNENIPANEEEEFVWMCEREQKQQLSKHERETLRIMNKKRVFDRWPELFATTNFMIDRQHELECERRLKFLIENQK